MRSGLENMALNKQICAYWEKEPCGTDSPVVGDLPESSRECFDRMEAHRHAAEPFIHSVARITRHRGKKVLEVGVEAGTNHLQWERAGCDCYGVDPTDAAIECTEARLATYRFNSNLQCINAEQLPWPNDTFDLVYSWGVTHHSEHSECIIQEFSRVLERGAIL